MKDEKDSFSMELFVYLNGKKLFDLVGLFEFYLIF